MLHYFSVFIFKNNNYLFTKFTKKTRKVHDLDVFTPAAVLKVRNHIFF